MTLAFVTLVALCVITIASSAMACSRRSKPTFITGSYLFAGMVVGGIEVIAAFSFASATGSSLVLAAAWMTLLLDLVGIVAIGLNYKKAYNPYLWFEWLIIILNIALIILYVHAYMAAP